MHFRCLLGILVVSCALTSPVMALEWYKAYSKAQEAMKDGDCQTARPLLLEAINQNPTGGLRVATYGTFRMEYIPHFYLAQCTLQSGNLTEARRYLKEAESSGAASSSKAKEFAALKSKLETLLEEKAKQGRTTAPVTQPAPEKPPPAKEKPPSSTVVNPPQAQPVKKPVTDQRTLLRRVLAEAGSALNLGQYEEAKDAANRALLLDPNNGEALRILEQINRRATEQDKQKAFAEINKALARGDWNDAESLLINLRMRYPSDPAVESVYKQIAARRESEFRKSQDAELKKANERLVLISYYNGQYQAAIELAKQGLLKNPDSWRLLFFKGCAYAALSLLQPENKEPLLQQARESFRRARQISEDNSLPPQISPKILQIYQTS